MVDSTTKLSDLNEILQISMGWTDTHLHMFVKDDVQYGGHDDGFLDDSPLDEEKYRIDALLKKEKDTFLYEYDFGDGWEHKDMMEWIGGKFDPEEFDAVVVNQILHDGI